MGTNICKVKILYKCIKANTSAIWQHYAAHTTNYRLLTSQNKQKVKSHTKEPYLSENGGLEKKRSGVWAKSRKG